MRVLALAVLASSLVSGAALAAPTSATPTSATEVSVVIGPKLQAEAAKTYGVKEVDRLAAELQHDVTRQIDRTGTFAGAKIELTLVDAKPNRPTFKQLGDKPGLSYQSFSLGGATIEGKATSIDGVVTPIRFSWYETDIHQAWYRATWGDAGYAFDRLAYRLGRGEAYASR
jgi:hypothetical protein